MYSPMGPLSIGPAQGSRVQIVLSMKYLMVLEELMLRVWK